MTALCQNWGFRLYVHHATQGLVARNTILWQCSAFDMDTTDRVICEDNTFTCTNTGVLPHGNSISGYDWNSGTFT